jgi:CNT family concentrative nucleoside transporter
LGCPQTRVNNPPAPPDILAIRRFPPGGLLVAWPGRKFLPHKDVHAMERLTSFAGLFVMIGLAWLLSANRRRINWPSVAIALALQVGLALLILRTAPGNAVFAWLGDVFAALLGFVDVGAGFVFGTSGAAGRDTSLLTSFAFGTLPTIIFFSSLMAVLYHLNVMQHVVRAAAVVMRRGLRLSGAESLAVAANVFLGQIEAPLVVRPYLATMTQSELMLVMLAGFATIAGGVMAAYVRMGIDAGHLVTASVISAPAAVLVAKILQPEVDEPQTHGRAAHEEQVATVNLFDAATSGAVVGLRIALQVGAVIIAFLALVAMCEFAFQWTLSQFGADLTLRGVLGYAFAPLAWTMGIPWSDCPIAGELLALRLVTNEFIAYAELGELLQQDAPIGPRAEILLTYALCGFANFGSIGVQLGGIGGAVPARQSDLARLGLRAMLGGMLACFMTACVAGVLL